MANKKINAPSTETETAESRDFSEIEKYLKRSYVNGSYTHNPSLVGQANGALFVLRALGYKVTRKGTSFTVEE